MRKGDGKIIELKEVHKKYVVNDETEVVLESVFYGFERGYKTSIIGSSGCGKTTILNIIGGVETNYEGEVYFNGEPIIDFDQFRRENISYIFQDLNLVPHLNLIDNIKIGLTNNVKHKSKKALELLKQVGLEDHTDKLPKQLSGGEKQRVAIARALARDTDILLCDEPTGSLDKKMKFEIMDLITEVFKEKTIIFVTHDLDISSKYSDIILGIEDGKIVERARKEVTIKANHSDKTPLQEKKDNTFNNRYIKNLLFNKFSLLNTAYLIIVIAAIFMFGIGAIKGVEREVDNYVIEEHKTDMFSIGNPGFSFDGMEQNMIDFNDKYREDIAGFMVGLRFSIGFDEDDSEQGYFLNNLQPDIQRTFEDDLVIGNFPTNNKEVLYSIGSARKMVFDYRTKGLTDEEEIYNEFVRVEGLTNQALLDDANSVNVNYRNSFRFNVDRFYKEDLSISGLIDDSEYVSSGVFEPERVDNWNTYGVNTNRYLRVEYEGEEYEQVVNTNIYMLDEEFKTYVSRVYIGLNSHSFHYVQIVVEEENLDLRENVFDKFLLFKPLFTGRDYISDERHEYYDDMFGYKVSILGGCALLGALGLVSLFNGIKSNVDKYKGSIGIYKTLGYTSKNIRRMFFIEGTIISIVIILSVLGLWGVLNLVLNESLILALDPNSLVSAQKIIHFNIFSAITIVLLIEIIVILSIDMQLKEVSIIELIRNK